MITHYTFQLNGEEHTINSCIIQKDYLLIHNREKVISLNFFDKKGIKVETTNTIFEADTYEECIVEILSLNLIVEDEDIAAELKLLELPVVKKETNAPSNLLDNLLRLSAAKI